MVDYVSTQATLHTRGINIDEKQYFFVVSCVLGEDKTVAYSMVYDLDSFKKALLDEEFEDYLITKKDDAESLLQTQEIKQLYELIESDYKAEIQTRAMELEDYSFTTGQIVQILQNLLHNRAEDLENSSVKDIISLINTLAAQGALQSGDNFGSHFIHIYPKFNALCTNCNKEFDVYAGMNCVCPHCKQVYRWSENERRFYPQPSKL